MKCFHCGGNAFVEDKGVIYVRAKVDDKWSNVPCCYPCWQMKYRGVQKEVKCKLCGKPNHTRSKNTSHSWVHSQHCETCNYLGRRSAYNNLEIYLDNKKKKG